MLNKFLKKHVDVKYAQLLIREYFEDKSNLYTITLLVCFLFGYGGYKLYTNYNNEIQVKAHADFNEALHVYNRALGMHLEGYGKSTEWEDAFMAFKVGYDRNKKAGIAPFFLAYQAQSLSRKGDYEEAIKILDNAINNHFKDVHWKYFFKTVKALIAFDFDQSAAMTELKALSSDEKNPINQMALYYMGEYYYAHNNMVQAVQAYNDIISKNSTNALDIVSPWVELANQRLQEIS